MEEYLLFADETKSTKDNPFFCFSGISVSRRYYENNLIKDVNSLKKKHFGTTGIIFHFSDMKKSQKSFTDLKDPGIRNSFWTDYLKLIDNTHMDILGVYFNENDMKTLYDKVPSSHYDLCFSTLLDNYVYYLKEKDACGQICVESRTLIENSYLQKAFYDYICKGSLFFSPKDASKHLTSLGFVIKGDNCIGLQIADMVPSQLLRYRKNSGTKDFYNLYKTLSTKIYNYGTRYEEILGLKKLL